MTKRLTRTVSAVALVVAVTSCGNGTSPTEVMASSMERSAALADLEPVDRRVVLRRRGGRRPTSVMTG